MAYSVKKNWISSFGFILTKPVIVLPFLIIAFFEGLALELVYFSARKPISAVAGPILNKYFGENALHYPADLYILPSLFYYAQLVIYIFISIFLIAISINIFKNIKMNLPIKATALIRNASSRYLSFVVYGLIIVFLAVILKNADELVYSKFTRFGFKYLPFIKIKPYFIGLIIFLFLSNCILHTFLILTVPIMVIQKRSLLRALGRSIYLGLRNFFSIFTLILLPFLVYLPVTLLKSSSAKIADKTFPEMTFYIVAAGIIIGALIDCFVFVCASQFLLDKEELKK